MATELAASHDLLRGSPVKTHLTPEKSATEKIADILYYIMRAGLIAIVVMLFFAAFNPIRVSENINKNMSLFSSALSYESMLSTFKVTLRRMEFLDPTFKKLSMLGVVIILAAVVGIVGGCMSLGNVKMKKYGLCFSAAAGAILLCGVMPVKGIVQSLADKSFAEGKFDAMKLTYPPINTVYIVIGIGLIVLSAVIFFLLPKTEKGAKMEMEPKFHLFLMMLPIIALAFVFSYLPLYGWRYAFFEYQSGGTLSAENFVGFKWFTSLFQNAATRRDMVTVLKNTLGMSALGIATSWLPMAFAIFLAEIKSSRFRQIVQTFTTIPNFISWVLVYAIALAIFNTDGFINTMINSINPDAAAQTNYLMSDSHMWLKMLAWGTWKGVGWSAIIYIASISGIDQGLYEAATVDGAGRFAKMWYVTVPELMPTFFVLLLMSIANILSNGMDQYLVFSNAINKESLQVLDLYVYNLGIGSGLIPLSTVIGMVKSLVSVTLLFGANAVSKALRGESIV